ncbi:hypothetical protein ABW20_dc0102516 [Dactylellina cionopaga]|nr:hypothetical protein ABW20_dc0102516 [Dactylellina cionopaga]
MHFAIYKLSTSPNPLVQRYYILYTLLLISLQVYLITAIIYHGRLLVDFDWLFVFHIFSTWITSIASIGRFVEHVTTESFDVYMKAVKEGKTVGRFDVVFAVIWSVSYVMVPFAIFGDFHYLPLTYLIPLPMM